MRITLGTVANGNGDNGNGGTSDDDFEPIVPQPEDDPSTPAGE